MTRNRKIQSHAIPFGYVIKVLIAFTFIVGIGVGYIWQENQNRALAQRKKDAELLLSNLQRNNKMRRNTLDSLKSPFALEQRIKELNLGLGQPQPGQIVRLPEPLNETLNPPLTSGNVRLAHAGIQFIKDSANKEMLR